MAKPQKSKKPDLADIELHPDAWQRFENFVKAKVPTRPVAAAKPTPSRPKASSPKTPRKA